MKKLRKLKINKKQKLEVDKNLTNKKLKPKSLALKIA